MKERQKLNCGMRIFGRRHSKGNGRRYTYGEFLVLLAACTEAHAKELMERLNAAECPKRLGEVAVPQDLSAVSYGALDDLRAIGANDDAIAQTVAVLTPLAVGEVYRQDVCDVFGFANMVRREVERINGIFASIKVKYSPEEIAAGVRELNFGSFGVLDWYARRMGVVNQNDVRDVAWVRIYQCMKIDAETNNYERRLRKQYETNRR